ncbi:tetratricopeptide repeat-containing serine/threonine-protein kinase [Nannocystis sp.]|uniref:tetratricopeptide repeat-containing serine/threonine-protein kinase n=1 Tax=Nannocystis sp. TaxID=1962667 RepID=UPI0025DF4AAF|nr:tetratricopeptide repeat-containing serine/threonine-protein kinase [Nannocystis sp.]MBK7828550.1 serine/threonine protein kinase [Nannocystis sp.]
MATAGGDEAAATLTPTATTAMLDTLRPAPVRADAVTVHEPGDRPAPSRDPDAELTRGDMIGRHIVLERLGAGGMGVVYAAYDPELDRKIAVKQIRGPGPGTSDEDRASATRLLREAKAMARLTHPNVITVHDVGMLQGGQVFIAMEFVDGLTLRAWQQRQPSWRETLAVYTQAGRGLAAAHAAGLVHRDFKPDNVLVGHDGRVRVLDFGLARADNPGAAPSPERRDLADLAFSRSSVIASALGTADPSDRLTQDGAIVGTPAYMAPEQRLGVTVDARGDQFSFCVSLWEALTGALPFAGTSQLALLVAVRKRQFTPVPRDSKVPRKLLRVLERGLASLPAERWPDMAALLAALAPERGRTRGLAVAAALTAAAVGLAIGLSRETDLSTRCLGAAARAAGVWDDEARAAVRVAFTATGLPYAASAREAVEADLDRHLADWQAMATDNCAATQIRGEQSPALMDRRLACLDERLEETRALVRLFRAADGPVVERSVHAARSLTPLSGCADAAALTAPETALPDAPEPRAAVVTRRLQLAELRALLHAGRYATGLALAQPLAAQAHDLGFRPLSAEADLLLGAFLCREGRVTEGSAALTDAVWTATAVKHDSAVVEATLELVYCVGARGGKLPEAQQWARHASAAIDRVGRDREANSLRLLGYRGLLAHDAGHYDEALSLTTQAVAAAERLHGPDSQQVATFLGYLGGNYQQLGRYREALHHHRRALAISERVLGPTHPRVGIECHNIAMILGHVGEYAAALRYQDRDLEIALASLGPDHPDTGLSYTNRGTLHTEAGHAAEGLRDLERADAIYARSVTDEHPDRIALDNNIGATLLDLGRLDEAEPHLRRAHAATLASLGPDHPTIAYSEQTLGRLLTLRGDFAGARAYLDRAIAIREHAFGPEHIDVVEAIVGLAQWWERQGRCDEALPLLRRGQHSLRRLLPADHIYNLLLDGQLAHCSPPGDPERLAGLERSVARLRRGGPPRERAELSLDLADALVHNGQPARARTLASEAVAVLAPTGPGHQRERERAAQWLATHPGP